MAEVRERKCRDYNIYMLRAMFTTDESAHECSRSIPAAPKLHFRIPAEDKSSNVPIRVKVEVTSKRLRLTSSCHWLRRPEPPVAVGSARSRRFAD